MIWREFLVKGILAILVYIASKEEVSDLMKEEIIRIEGSDGPTAVFIAGRNKGKIPLKQRIQRFINKIRRAYIEKTIKADPHTLDQVCEYIVSVLGYKEISSDQPEYQEEYHELRASYILQHKPELLGDLAFIPDLTEHTQEAINEYLEQMKLREEAARRVPKEMFDIDFHKFLNEDGDNESHFIIEKTRNYIGGGASGNAKTVKRHNHEFKQVYRYYGVLQEDIDNKTERFEEVVRILAMPMR